MVACAVYTILVPEPEQPTQQQQHNEPFDYDGAYVEYVEPTTGERIQIPRAIVTKYNKHREPITPNLAQERRFYARSKKAKHVHEPRKVLARVAPTRKTRVCTRVGCMVDGTRQRTAQTLTSLFCRVTFENTHMCDDW